MFEDSLQTLVDLFLTFLSLHIYQAWGKKDCNIYYKANDCREKPHQNKVNEKFSQNFSNFTKRVRKFFFVKFHSCGNTNI